MLTYNIRRTGRSHEAQGRSCEDASNIKLLDDGWILAAVADGVGSCSNAATGSELAVNSVIEYCKNNFSSAKRAHGDFNRLILAAYQYALSKVKEKSEVDKQPFKSYDSALSVALYDGQHIHYGHSGDSAIVGLKKNGEYATITTQQKGQSANEVIPLRWGPSYWEIGFYDEELVSVLLLTDGIFEGFVSPWLLRLDSSVPDIYIPATTLMMDPDTFCDEGNTTAREIMEKFIAGNCSDEWLCDRYATALQKKGFDDESIKTISADLHNGYDITLIKRKPFHVAPLEFLKGVTDDIAAIGLINTNASFDSMPLDYYKDLNWKYLYEEMDKALYPQLYTTREDENDIPKATSEESDAAANDEREEAGFGDLHSVDSDGAIKETSIGEMGFVDTELQPESLKNHQ
jgi:hypothetical protein